ncbi:ABC transporter permease [Clostridium sp. JN-1]|uniref:ABC transporter permease n=1 Tax=Clostridium sp. JN-1 TaxID=2483110 RepID=UPI000F0B4693|nr:ABC transporter permease [Clostridium sp. JN-1]
MSNLIRGEFYKLRKSKYLIAIILAILAVIFILPKGFDANMTSMRGSLPEQVANGIYSIGYAFAWIPMTSFIFALFAGEFIAKDLKNTMSKSFIYGYKRSKVILSKLIVFIISFLFLELIYITSLCIYASINYGFCRTLNYSTILYLIRVIGIGIMYSAATMSIVYMIAIITKSNVCTTISPFLFMLAMAALNDKEPTASIIKFIFPFMSGSEAMARFAPKSVIITGITSSIVIFAVTTLISILYVKYEDIK